MHLLETDLSITDSKVRVHCHCLIVDANGKVKIERLAEFLRDAAIDYAVPRSKLTEAKARDEKFRSGSAVSSLHREAIRAFTDLTNTGEGGEMLVFLLCERFLKMPLVISKMDLKTDPRMHYHGADGVYATADKDGVLNLYWGESKMYEDPTTAIRDCLKSLSPFLNEPDAETSDREQDLLLLSSKADLDDPHLTAAFRKYFDKKSSLSNRVRYCGVALVGFDAKFYTDDTKRIVFEDVAAAAKAEIEKWSKAIGRRIIAEKLGLFDIHFFCVPMPSVDGFRSAFLKALGK
ncbi:HamA C-terminal domain-containing protein [Methylobacterium sp. Leaf118]|uniref:HamA C-terminal domain-containing protein n=1 Tax=Methylobacterium sp. Leaf118 TaxID=2876562 RepID=UPI001E4E7439|nr:DUF1837 domain-containing protein [Methylobacterium sp. Leaf118]